MDYAPDPEFQALYNAYTATPDAIGPHLNDLLGQLSRNDPLLVATGSDIVIFPGGGRAPVVESFRLSTRGFVEITAISHLGVAVPYLIRLRELDHPDWESDTRRFIAQTQRVRAINNEAYWRDVAAVEAWRGLERKIVDMVDYACVTTIDFLEKGLADPARLTFPFVRDNFLDATGPEAPAVAMNDMMAATFALVFLDTGYRVIRWTRDQDIDWERSMVLISGRAGRPTAGVTWQTNSMCNLLWQASGRRLDPERLYIAPHAPGLVLADLDGPDGGAAIEAQFRRIWFSSRATVEMGRLMYADYPAFRRDVADAPVVDAATQSISQIPLVRSADDRRAIVTRMRFVMEDPAQQLANAGAQFIVDQLAANGNRPEDVVVPGLTNVDYPRSTAA